MVKVREMHYKIGGLFSCHIQIQAPSYHKVGKTKGTATGKKGACKEVGEKDWKS